ncbi:MAG: ATP-binding cassette domain-containing protein [Candidatus Gastranaerophilales bacterium]|nr:ATP-binding cassette domain-containing protein [Candidatus Gastranaerophilales bacterium]
MYTVEIKNLVKTFDKAKAIDNLSLNIEKGKITGLIGADGSGKTTLIRLIIGLLVGDEGEITTLGLNPVTQKEELNYKIGYMPQKFGLYEDLTVIENLRLYADLKNEPYDFDKLLEFTVLSSFQNRLAGALSGGMKQKLGLACTLIGTPDFLLLDEPSVGVDPISRRDLMKMVRDLISPQTTVLWSTAYLDEAHSFDTTIVLDKGKVIYEGKPHDLAPTAQEFENKIIDLMGGYKKEKSLIAENYIPIKTNLSCTVEADNLEKKYGDFYAVRNNSFCINRGEIFGLLGPNGAGKSTSFKMMCGLTKPGGGTARIMGIDILKDPAKARSNLGYMAQKFSLYGSLTVRQNLEFFASAYGINFLNRTKRVDEIIDVFGFGAVQNRLSEDLPLGFKQRLSMACALIHNPPILFLDEPTSGVDVVTRRDFWNHITSLAKKGVTILVTTHFMDEAEYCDRISLFYKGETIAIGTPDELKQKANANNMEETFITLIKESEL